MHFLQVSYILIIEISIFNMWVFFSLFFQTPLKLDAVKALRKEPVVETKIPFVRESKQATHLYVTLVSLKKNQLD